MQMTLIPGYESLFGKPEKSYEDTIKELPSEIIIAIAIMLNNELNAPYSDEENQTRLRTLIAFRFSAEQNALLNQVYSKFSKKTKGQYNHYVFGRRYLIAMILKEFNRNVSFELQDTSPIQEFNFLMAYLMVIDEVNKKDSAILDNEGQYKADPLFRYRMLWPTQIHQFQFNEKPNVPFETFKLLCFCKYALHHSKPYLKEYLEALHFKTIGEFIHSFYQVAIVTMNNNENNVFKKLSYIKPKEGNGIEHLELQCINQILDKPEAITLPDIKRRPLYFREKTGYMIIDNDIYIKKLYKGPFFELYRNTSLNEAMNFNTYSAIMSEKVSEHLCFGSIMTALHTNKWDFIYLNDGTENAPDCYYRSKKTVFLFEFKAYIFPDNIPENPSFDGIRNYIDARFVNNEGGRAKGIQQLTNQIDLLKKGYYSFDEEFCENFVDRNITVYPIICFDEFYFTLPGVNEYLNDLFTKMIQPLQEVNINIKPVTLINLDILFDLIRRGRNIKTVEQCIERYWSIIRSRQNRYSKEPSTEGFLLTASSFDEIYHKFLVDAPKNSTKSNFKIEKTINITQTELDEKI